MANYIFNIGAMAARGANRWRKSRTPELDAGYVADLLNTTGVTVTGLAIAPVKDSAAGYKNFYYKMTGQAGNEGVRYFGSMPDKWMEPSERVTCLLAGFLYKGPIERKRKDFDDLTFLNSQGVPSTRPVAFDEKTGLLIELYQDGTDLGGFLESRDFTNDSKLGKCRQALHVLRQTQGLGRYSGEAFTENFMVTPDGQVVITDMERSSALNDRVAHELAALVYTASRSVEPQELLKLARELYPVETIRKLPRYSWRMLMFSDPLTVWKTVAAVKEVRK